MASGSPIPTFSFSKGRSASARQKKISINKMAERRQGLRSRLWTSKVANEPPKSNAQKCREYRERLETEDPSKNQERLQRNKANSKKWRNHLVSGEKERQKIMARVRQRKRRLPLSSMVFDLTSKVANEPPKSNAQKCREYRERLETEDPSKNQERLQRNKANSKKWRDDLVSGEKERQKIMARLRQQKRRQRLKEKETANPSPLLKKTSKTATPTVKLSNEKENKKEQAKIRQARRRERIKSNPQKYQREKEKRSARYYRDKFLKSENATENDQMEKKS